ncbi:MAG: type II toxin-antitoxin system RelE/ParE family toxin [Patescibacteria group bacterium]|jgi:phage-related protein
MKIQILPAVNQFVFSLDESIIAKVLRTIDLLERFGNQLQLPHSKSVGHRLFELRIHGRQEIRIFYGYYENRAILLHGLIKKSNKIPKHELSTAYSRFKDLT